MARAPGVSKATIHHWKAKSGGMQLNELKRIKELEEENRKLKHLYAELAPDNKMLMGFKQMSRKTVPLTSGVQCPY